MSDLVTRYAASVMNTFGRPRLVLTRGEGAYVWDDQGNRYLDLLGGIAVNALGHGHPALVDAVTTQLKTLGHVSNFFATEPQVALAERLVDLLGTPGRVFFTSSGTEANEAAFKATRRTGRTRLVAAEGSFHGRTLGGINAGAQEKYREGFGPRLPGFRSIAWEDVEALKAEIVKPDLAAVVIEPVQGEGGVREASHDFLRTLRKLCSDNGVMLIYDEIQCGASSGLFEFVGFGQQPLSARCPKPTLYAAACQAARRV